MSSLSDCCSPCEAVAAPVQVPGPPGPTGASARSTVTAGFVIPAVGSNVTPVTVSDTAWMQVGQNLYIGGANFVIAAAGILGPTTLTLKYLGLNGDVAAGATIAIGALVSPGMGNNTVASVLNALSALTDNTAGVAGNSLSVNTAKQTIIVGPFSMPLLVNGQNFKVLVPFAFTILAATFRCDVAISTGAKAATLTTGIDSGVVTNCTGGVMAVAGAYASGATQAGTAITAANTGAAGSAVNIAVGSVTTFIEGSGHVELTILNTDLAAAIASIASKFNTVLAALV